MRRFVESIRSLCELIAVLWRGPYWWSAPLVVVLIPTAVLFAVLKIAPIVAPFVYALF